jgi:hypothetical protein
VCHKNQSLCSLMVHAVTFSYGCTTIVCSYLCVRTWIVPHDYEVLVQWQGYRRPATPSSEGKKAHWAAPLEQYRAAPKEAEAQKHLRHLPFHAGVKSKKIK